VEARKETCFVFIESECLFPFVCLLSAREGARRRFGAAGLDRRFEETEMEGFLKERKKRVGGRFVDVLVRFNGFLALRPFFHPSSCVCFCLSICFENAPSLVAAVHRNVYVLSLPLSLF